MNQSCCILGIDVGGTKIAAGIVRFPEAEVLFEERVPTRPNRPPSEVLRDLQTLANHLSARAKSQGHSISAVGLGICELVDPGGKIFSSNCLKWKSEDLTIALEHIGPLTIEADVRAAALAEALFGAGKLYRNFLYFTIGTGISSCLVLEGKPYTGAAGAAGTMASSVHRIPCPNCGAPNSHTLEEIASGPALVQRYFQAGHHADDARDVLDAAERGEPAALQIIHSAAECLGSYIAHLINTLDPGAVILGGGLGLAGGLFHKRTVDSIRNHVWAPTHREIPLRTAETGGRAGVIGAAACAWKSCSLS